MAQGQLPEEYIALGKDLKSIDREILTDALDLTIFWNQLGKQGESRNNKKSSKNPYSHTRPVSIAQCRSIARDDSKSLNSMSNHSPKLPKTRPTPFVSPKAQKQKNNTTDQTIEEREIEEKLDISSAEFSEEEDIMVRYKSSKATDSIFTLKEKMSPIHFRRKRRSQNTSQFSIKSMAEELEENGMGYMLNPLNLEEPKDQITKTKTRRTSTKTTPTKTQEQYVKSIDPNELYKLTHSDSSEVFFNLASEGSDPHFMLRNNSNERYNLGTEDQSSDEETALRFEASTKFMELYPEKFSDDEAFDNFVDDYIAKHKKTQK
ncbi:hypothetical protein TVAGG3_0486830 [Trichomonas vaginalis G3]|nr:hypothetical protein TVAGG3_0486830 [Trichomonas vaginalis G3]KAI5516092.1 hypothetical protein TVAGG3_0486830 [Trichomonas vaginalis G3]